MSLAIFITTLIVLLFPVLLMWGEKRNKLISTIGAVLLCYAIGLILGNVGFTWPKHFIENNISAVSVPLAIPLLMFGSNPKTWKKLGPVALLSFAAGAVAVIFTILVANFIWSDNLENLTKISAMLVGVYTGGTPNMVAIGTALNAPAETITTLTIVDTVLCAVYLLFLLSIAERVLGLFLKPGVRLPPIELEDENLVEKSKLKNGVVAVLLSAACFAFGIGLSLLITGVLDTVIILLTLTVSAFVLSFSKRVNKLRISYTIGEYLILVFCLAIGLMSDFSVLANVSLSLLSFCAFVVFGSILMHFTLAKLLGVDVHHVMITSTAALFGPAFVGMIASRLKNKALITSGMTTGVIGYVVANVLGIAVFRLLELIN